MVTQSNNVLLELWSNFIMKEIVRIIHGHGSRIVMLSTWTDYLISLLDKRRSLIFCMISSMNLFILSNDLIKLRVALKSHEEDIFWNYSRSKQWILHERIIFRARRSHINGLRLLLKSLRIAFFWAVNSQIIQINNQLKKNFPSFRMNSSWGMCLDISMFPLTLSVQISQRVLKEWKI